MRVNFLLEFLGLFCHFLVFTLNVLKFYFLEIYFLQGVFKFRLEGLDFSLLDIDDLLLLFGPLKHFLVVLHLMKSLIRFLRILLFQIKILLIGGACLFKLVLIVLRLVVGSLGYLVENPIVVGE